ncbi:hypothetical protein HPB50_017514 [Hyalomma asiaticum]|uniref:Uncharacterized protein n=1 Tax=Hyalomma asiaticum TaxID=266040 RepID=A0ACB7SER6_HYAAI|nr:hypothetical protein HPB50_017514 [Hyalomma asiaticum]
MSCGTHVVPMLMTLDMPSAQLCQPINQAVVGSVDTMARPLEDDCFRKRSVEEDVAKPAQETSKKILLGARASVETGDSLWAFSQGVAI